jgi:3-methyladenine DNA glycosylase AlkC
MMPPNTKRVGATSKSAVTPALLQAFARGEAETRTLVEILSVDLRQLMHCIEPAIEASALSSGGIMARMRLGGALLFEHCSSKRLAALAGHTSDIVRGWAAFAIEADSSLTLPQRVKAVRTFADDPHMGVREWAWMALRPALPHSLEEGISLLIPWTLSQSPFLRRFATEATRPRGVWCAHLEALKENPALGLPLLEPLNCDSVKYVQDSVANWLNDAAKTQPDWVRQLCKVWLRKSNSAATARITTRAMRSIER